MGRIARLALLVALPVVVAIAYRASTSASSATRSGDFTSTRSGEEATSIARPPDALGGRPRRAGHVLLALLCAAIGFSACGFGVVDLVSSEGPVVLLGGLLLAIVGLSLIWASVVALTKQPVQSRLEVATHGAAVGVLIGVTLLAIQLSAAEVNSRLAIWLVLAALPAALSWQLRRRGGSLRWVKGTTVAAVAAALLPLTQGFAGERFVSAREAPGLQAAVNLSIGSGQTAPGAAAVVPVTVSYSLENLSEQPVTVIAESISIFGNTSSVRRPVDDRQFLRQLQDQTFPDGFASRTEVDFKPLLLELQLDPTSGADRELAPGGKIRGSYVSYVAAGSFRSLSAAYHSGTVATRQVRLVDFNVTNEGGVRSAGDAVERITEWSLREISWARRLTRGQRYLHASHVVHATDATAEPYLFAYVDDASRRNKPLARYNDRLARQYGLDLNRAATTVELRRG